MSLSMTGSSIVVFAVMWVLKYFNIGGIGEDQVATFVSNTIQAISFITLLIGQARRSDVKFGVFKV